MGSSKKTYRDYQTVQIMNSSRSFYTEVLLATWFKAGKADAKAMTMALNHSVNMFLSPKKNKRFGINADVNIVKEKLEDDAILNYIKLAFNVNATRIVKKVTKNVDGAWLFIGEWLQTQYSTVGDDTWAYQIDVYDEEDDITFKPYIYVHRFNINGSVYQADIWNGYTTNLDGSYNFRIFDVNDWNNHDKDIYLTTPVDNYMYTMVIYESDGANGTHTMANIIRTDDPMKTAYTDTALAFVIKSDGEYVADNTKRKKKLLQNLGLQTKKKNDEGEVESFETQIMENENTKDVIFTFGDSPYGYYWSLLREFYGFYDVPRTITATIDDITIKYFWDKRGRFIAQYNSQAKTGDHGVNILGVDNHDEDGNVINQYLIVPLSVIRKQPIKRRYDMVEKLLVAYYYSEVVVKKSFFQSMFFQIVVGVASTLITGNPWAGLAAVGGSLVIGEIAKNNPELGAILSIALMIAVGSAAGGGITVNPSQVLNIVNQVSQVYFTGQYAQIQEGMEELADKMQDAQDEINEMKKKTYYTPMDSYDLYFDIMYEAQYNYDQYFDIDHLYNYDTTRMIL